uniref:Uncharacterized protein n=1 Tax=Helianthus annuus TaxID=4232 RepID=A0A251SBS5_HELAN
MRKKKQIHDSLTMYNIWGTGRTWDARSRHQRGFEDKIRRTKNISFARNQFGNHWGQVESSEIKEFTGSMLRFLLFSSFLYLLQ